MLVVGALAIYTATGLAVAAAFVLFGAGSPPFPPGPITLSGRAMLLPGAFALWPMVLCRWLRAAKAASP